MPTTTKDRIIAAAQTLFREEGVCQVRLQHIADQTGISVGNLAYHFKNKDAVIEEVYVQVFAAFDDILALFLQEARLQDMDSQFRAFFNFMNQYRFCFTDSQNLIRTNPTLAKRWQSYLQKMHWQLEKRLSFGVQQGQLKAEAWPGCYHQLALNLSLTFSNWLSQQILLGNDISPSQFNQALWAQIQPHLTESGQVEVRQFLPIGAY